MAIETKCVHCERGIREQDSIYIYPASKASAHARCVSLPSRDETDNLLVAQRISHSTRGSRTGRV